MTLLQLQYFRELGKTLHYTKAAEHLHISQPGLSYSISELEKELGSKLFEKKNRKFQLTPAGQVFMQYVEQALDTITTGVDAFHAVVASTEERVALGYLHSISSSFIPQMVKRFYQENPHSPILFDFVQDLGPNLVQQLKDRPCLLPRAGCCTGKRARDGAGPVFGRALLASAGSPQLGAV